MKITHNKVGQNVNVSDTNRSDKTAKTKKSDASSVKDGLLSSLDTKSTDDSSTVQLSKRAQDIKKAKELAMAAPDVREDRVQELQKLIDSGKYNVSAKDVADKMIDEEAQWT